MQSSTMRRGASRRRLIAAASAAALLGPLPLLTSGSAGAASAAAGLGSLAPAATVRTAGLVPGSGACDTTVPGTATCDLWARAGTVVLPPSTTVVPVWSYAPSDQTAGSPTPVGAVGPTMVVTQGDAVTITLHNQLPAAAGNTSLSLPQVDAGLAEDTAGIPAGPASSKAYTFTAERPGTYLYQAGPTENGSRQAAMGLVGALVVRPSGAPSTAYGTGTGFTDEAVLVLTEIDPAFAAAPMTFDMRAWTARYRLINGQVHPDAAPVSVTAGSSTLLRVVNGGSSEHALGVLGAQQRVVGLSSHPLDHPYRVFAENVAPGDTMDTLVALPATGGPKYPVLDTAGLLDNNGAVDGSKQVVFGGMLTYLDTEGTGGPVATGPVATVSVSPVRSGASGATATATFTPEAGHTVVSTEYMVDSGPWTPLSSCTATCAFGVGAGLPTGSHTIAVRATDDASVTGAVGTFGFVTDTSGPTVSGLGLTPDPSNGSTTVSLSGTASDATSGGSEVTGVSFQVAGGPSGTLALSGSGATRTFSGTIPSGVASGNRVVTVTATDALGNTGTSTVTLHIDTVGPTTTVAISPSPNDGTLGSPAQPDSLEISAVVSDATTGGSAISQAEATFLGITQPLTRVVVGGVETWRAYVPLSELVGHADGSYGVTARGRDAAGNWGPVGSATFELKRGALFADGFETSTAPFVPPWASSAGNLGNATGSAALLGIRSMSTTFSSSTAGRAAKYVVDTTPAAEINYQASFRFNPGSFNPGNSTVAIFTALRGTGSGAETFQVQLRRQNNGNRQVRLHIDRSGSGGNTTGWVTVGTGSHTLAVDWHQSTTARITFTVDGVSDVLSPRNTSGRVVDTVRLGVTPTGTSTSQLSSSTSGTAYFDDFISTNRP